MERPKYRYHLAFQCTKNGHFRANMTYYVNASSEAEAKRLVKESYPDAKAFRIIGKWENTPRKTNNANAKESTATTKKVNSAPKAAESCGAGRKTSDVPHVEPEEIIRSIWNKRKAEMRKLQEQLEANYSRNLSRLTSECEAKRTKLNKELDRTKKTIEEKAAYRKTVGLFQFEKRKSIKREIVRLKKQQEAISRELQQLDDNLYAEKFKLENEKVAEHKRLYQRAKESVPTPRERYSFGSLPIEEVSRLNRLVYTLLEMEPGKRYTTTGLSGMANCSNSAITSMLRHPTAQSYTVRTVEQGRAYYTLNIPKE